MDNRIRRIAWFVSPHGKGHASRASAIMASLTKLDTSYHFDIYTLVPESFFMDSRIGDFTYYSLEADLGLVQLSPYEEDLDATLQILETMIPFDDARIQSLAARLRNSGVAHVVCDIAPMGIAAAKVAGIRSVLIESFRWDWIYEGYLKSHPEFSKAIDYFNKIFFEADVHIQAKPICDAVDACLTSNVVSRLPQMSRKETRHALGFGNDHPILLVSGDVPADSPALKYLGELSDVRVLITATGNKIMTDGNLTYLPHDSTFFYPDLIEASDCVVGKLGYSTMAEVYWAGVPFVYIGRNQFRESPYLAAFVKDTMPYLSLTPQAFPKGEWVEQARGLVSAPRTSREEPNGAEEIASYLYHLDE